MSISEQVKELREYAREYQRDISSGAIMGTDKLLSNAADTIEALSAKLSAANMERSANGGGWIPCKERLPEEHESIFKKFKGTEKWKDAMFETTSNEVEVTVEFEDGTRKTMTAHTIDGKWKVDTFVKNKVIAWKPFSEPYREDLNE